LSALRDRNVHPKRQSQRDRFRTSAGNEYEAIPKSLVDRITEERAVEKAVKNVKRYTSETGAGIVFWSDNQRLWADNLHVSEIYSSNTTLITLMLTKKKKKIVTPQVEINNRHNTAPVLTDTGALLAVSNGTVLAYIWDDNAFLY
jgi:hypothetical protein